MWRPRSSSRQGTAALIDIRRAGRPTANALDTPRSAHRSGALVACSLALSLAGGLGATIARAAVDADAVGRCGDGAPAVPSPDALEGLGVRIGQIDIVVEDIFDPANPAEDAAPYRLANKLHINTREMPCARNCCSRKPSRFRNRKSRKRAATPLRGRRYLFDAHIAAGCYS